MSIINYETKLICMITSVHDKYKCML